MAGDTAVPEASTVMMMRHFTAERCANASVPVLRFDATTPVAPLKYGLLETSGTSPSSSYAISSLMTPKPMDPSASFAAAGTSSGGEAPRAPPGQQEQGESSRPVGARRQRSPAPCGADAGHGESRCARDLQRPDPSGSNAQGRSERVVALGSGAGSPCLGEHRSGA
jgi:hypothetical protein